MATYPSPTLQNLTVNGTATLTDVSSAAATITGGTIDGTPIGATTPAAVHATTISSTGAATLASVSTASATLTGGTVDGVTIGGTTPEAIHATTLSASGTVSGAGFTNLLSPYPTSATLAGTAVGDGAYLIGYQYPATGSVARTVQTRLQDIVSVLDMDTLADAWAAALYKPLINPTTGQTYFNTDPSKLNYSTSRAGYVWQHRDTATGASQQLIPAAVFQVNSTGNGVVNASIETSYTIWQGVWGYHNKTGDGSGQCFTATGQLGAYGSGGYNELGGFQAQLTNVGSALGTISGVEMLLSDSPDSGTTTYSTKMQAVVGRIAKYNPTTRPSYNFYASSEGTLAPNGIVGVNPSGNKFQRGLDFGVASFSTGQATLFPNNTAMAWLDSTSTAQTVLGVDASNNTYAKAATTASTLNLQDGAGTTRLQITSAGLVAYQNATLAATATAGTNGAPPAQVSGYLEVVVNGTTVKIPYYNV